MLMEIHQIKSTLAASSVWIADTSVRLIHKANLAYGGYGSVGQEEKEPVKSIDFSF